MKNWLVIFFAGFFLGCTLGCVIGITAAKPIRPCANISVEIVDKETAREIIELMEHHD